MEFIATTAANIGSSVAAAAAVAQLVGNEVESSAPVQAVQAIKKLTASQIIKKMQGLESALSNLKEQLIASCVMDKNGEPIQKMRKEQKEKETKEPKEKKEKEPKEKKEKKTKEVVIVDENEKKQNKIPMPWTGVADYDTCVALKTLYGLFIQCGKPQDMSDNGLIKFNHDGKDCGFCADCFAKCDQNGNHPIGTVQDRLASAVGQFIHGATGKKESHYLEVLTKMNITKEEALEAAEKRGVKIPDFMFEPVEKKRGRPAKMDVASTTEKAEKPMKEKKEKKEKKVASVETADTPEKETANNGEGAAEKKKRGRPAKTVQQSNVGQNDMEQLIAQATAAKKKRLSFDPSEAEIAPVPIQFNDEDDDETLSAVSTEENRSTVASASAVAVGTVDEVDEDGFFNFNDDEAQQEQQQEVVEAVVAVPVEPEKKKKEKKEKVEKKDKKEKADKKVKADKGEGEEAADKKKKKSKKAEKKEEEIVVAAAAAADEQVEKEEEEEELECEEYEYEGETYGLASNGDLYTQDGDLVGKVENGVPSFN
jgi:hypothetical protein